MKKTIALLLAAALLAAALAGCAAPAKEAVPTETAAPAETQDFSPRLYTVGEKMDDFTVTTSDGQTLQLYELLETKELVLLNFWATWCGPCRMEFPYMQEAYQKYQDKVQIIALSADDDNASIESFKQANGLTSLPMAYDETGLSRQFSFSGIPTSVAIDRFGVVCWQESGAITDTEKFERLFDGFLGDSYTQSKVNYRIPGAKPTMANPSEEELNKALNVPEGTLKFTNDTDPYAWPFLPAADGKVTSSNTDVEETYATVLTTVTAKTGDVLAFDYAVNTPLYGNLSLNIDGQDVAGFCLNRAGTYGYRFDADGTYAVKFIFTGERFSSSDGFSASLDQVRLLSGGEAAALLAQQSVYEPFTNDVTQLVPVDARPAVIYMENNVSDQLRSYLYLPEENASSVTVKVIPGRELNPDFCVYFSHDGLHTLSEAQYDGEAFYIDGNMSNNFLTISLLPDVRTDNYLDIVICKDPASATSYVSEMFVPGVTWAYEEDMPGATPVGPYEITFLDPDGKPVPGVAAQICTDEVCNVMNSDANGVVTVTDTSTSYEVHVLKVPEGYQLPAETFALSGENSSITITLQKQ